LLAALVWQESRWKVAARSPVGAIGLGQLMPGTAQQLGVNPRNPEQNLLGAAIYLRQQLDRFDNDIELALAAYNAGPGRVERARAIPAIAETRNYVAAITGRLSAQARAD
jgi:soluble lytic murein transglycosylase-like protein